MNCIRKSKSYRLIMGSLWLNGYLMPAKTNSNRRQPLHPSPNSRRPKMTNIRLLGNTALLHPVVNQQPPSGLIINPNHYNKPTLVYQVLSVGPGAWIKHKKKRSFVKPEVQPGDFVIIRTFDEGSVCLRGNECAEGDLIANAQSILAKWSPQ